MSAKGDFKHGINLILQHNQQGAYATHYARKSLLLSFANDLHQHTVFKPRNIYCLKEKHIRNVVAYWQQQGLSAGTIKNRTAALRWLAQKINKANIMPSNTQLNIDKRVYVSPQNKALINPDFSGITNPYVRVSLELQRLFGLRREESLKIKPQDAASDGQYLRLRGAWCKNGRPREIPIITDEQRHWINKAIELANTTPNGTLIPRGKNYIQQRWTYDKQVQRAGLNNLHGLRHAYAQQRYLELTGFPCPIAGGPSRKSLTSEQKVLDKQARLTITELLGHSRVGVVKNYLN
jgi:integrase